MQSAAEKEEELKKATAWWFALDRQQQLAIDKKHLGKAEIWTHETIVKMYLEEQGKETIKEDEWIGEILDNANNLLNNNK